MMPQRWFGSQPKQAIKNNDRGTTAQISFGRDGVLRGRRLIGHLRPKFDKRDARSAFSEVCIQNFRRSAAQAFQFFAHQFTACFPNTSRTSIFQPRRRKRCAATRRHRVVTFPAKTMHFPGGKNLTIAQHLRLPCPSMFRRQPRARKPLLPRLAFAPNQNRRVQFPPFFVRRRCPDPPVG